MPVTRKLPGVLSDEEIAEKAREELNEDPDRVKSDIKAIREWIKKQPHLSKNARTDDHHILAFLRGCKFSLERTKEKVDMYYSVRAACPDWFSNWDIGDPVIQDFMNIGIALPLSGYDKHGRKVILYRTALMDPKKHTLSDNFKYSFMVNDLLVEEMGQASVTGFVVIQDGKGMNMGHMSTFTPAMGKKAMTIWQDSYPQRPKSLHFLNMPAIVEGIFNLMKSFAKEKIRKRMMVHPKGELGKLHEDVGTEVLPEEYGGTNGKVQDHVDRVRSEFESRSKFLLEQSKLRSNEKKRAGKPKTHSDIFGIEGSFRQLTFD